MTDSGKHQPTRQPESPRTRPVLVVTGGLPATGKSTASRAVARRLGATYLRIDTIRQSLFTFSAPGADTDALHIDRCPASPLNLSSRTPQYTPEDTSGRAPGAGGRDTLEHLGTPQGQHQPKKSARPALEDTFQARPALEDTPPQPPGHLRTAPQPVRRLRTKKRGDAAPTRHHPGQPPPRPEPKAKPPPKLQPPPHLARELQRVAARSANSTPTPPAPRHDVPSTPGAPPRGAHPAPRTPARSAPPGDDRGDTP